MEMELTCYVNPHKALRGSGSRFPHHHKRVRKIDSIWALSVWIHQGSKYRPGKKGRGQSITINGNQVLMVL